MELNSTELRNQIHQLINEADDDKLNNIQAYLIALQNEKADWWEAISAQEQEIIYKSRKLEKIFTKVGHTESGSYKSQVEDSKFKNCSTV